MALLDAPLTSELYQADRERLAYVANYSRMFALAPGIYAGWVQLAAAVRGGMDERRYELVTLAAARGLGSAYCSLAHAAVLQKKFGLFAAIVDRHGPGLDATE